ncbi:hypothetical protein T484DRAFT_3107352 [Baffinella frigidus]|nr:hypothetical protein T484DRAFT_3107352 [Cryptophyta sp. CCMP2293]
MALFVAWLLAHLSARPEMEGGPALLQEVVDHHVALHAALLSRAASSPSASSLASSDTPGAAHARLAAGSGSSASEGSLGAGGAHDVASSNLQGAAGKTYLGWCAEPQGSEAGGAVATQPTCLATLALAAGTRYTFEPAAYPLRCENKPEGYTYRHQLLSEARGTRTATNCSKPSTLRAPRPGSNPNP